MYSIKVLICLSILSLAATVPALAEQQLSGDQVRALIVGKRFGSSIWPPPGITFKKDNHFRLANGKACGGKDPHTYKIDRHGLLTIEFRTCEGKKEHSDYFYILKAGSNYYISSASGGYSLPLRRR